MADFVLYRERAAYVCSQALGGLCDVPPTFLARINAQGLDGEQQGSLQKFVTDACDMSDIGPEGLDDDQVHKVRRNSP